MTKLSSWSLTPCLFVGMFVCCCSCCIHKIAWSKWIKKYFAVECGYPLITNTALPTSTLHRPWANAICDLGVFTWPVNICPCFSLFVCVCVCFPLYVVILFCFNFSFLQTLHKFKTNNLFTVLCKYHPSLSPTSNTVWSWSILLPEKRWAPYEKKL